MARIPAAELEQLKNEIAVERLVEASGIALKCAGKDLIGRCSFHEDVEALLVVTPAKNLERARALQRLARDSRDRRAGQCERSLRPQGDGASEAGHAAAPVLAGAAHRRVERSGAAARATCTAAAGIPPSPAGAGAGTADRSMCNNAGWHVTEWRNEP